MQDILRLFTMKRLIDGKWLRAQSRVSPWQNLVYLALDYLCVVLVLSGAIAFDLWRRSAGLHWAWTLPVWLPAAGLNGILQHRMALMGHEASHFLLHPNRRWNDVLADLLCFYPVFGTLANYRAKHLGHHLHPNDPELDPNLGGGKFERFYARFPMAKRSFLLRHVLGFFWPPFVLTNLIDLMRVVMLGQRASEQRNAHRSCAAIVSWLGVGHILVLALLLRLANMFGFSVWGTLVTLSLLGFTVWALLPRSVFGADGKSPLSPKLTAFLRMGFYSTFLGSTALITHHTGYQCFPAFFVLWVFPLAYVFPYLMLLRELFQHANAGTGALDNSRIMKVSPWLRWSLLGYGNDYHLIHHLYPNIPCYRLQEVHRRLAEESALYREQVEETQGCLESPAREGIPTLLESLSADRAQALSAAGQDPSLSWADAPSPSA